MQVTVDAVVFAYLNVESNKELNVLLIKRAFEPFINTWALPGGFMNEDESADKSVIRKLKEETNVKLDYLEQLYTFTKVNRDPRERIVSISYYALINPDKQEFLTNIHAKEVSWFPMSAINHLRIGFDHKDIIKYAHERLKNKIIYEPIGFELLPKQFSMSDLHSLYCAVLGNDLDRRNFAKKINSFGLLNKTKNKTSGHIGKRAQLFEFNKEKYNELKLKGFNFDI
jgi:8-oxo-dGTP diphosphatase